MRHGQTWPHEHKYYEGRLREDTNVSMHRALEIRIEIIIIFITYELQRLLCEDTQGHFEKTKLCEDTHERCEKKTVRGYPWAF